MAKTDWTPSDILHLARASDIDYVCKTLNEAPALVKAAWEVVRLHRCTDHLDTGGCSIADLGNLLAEVKS